MLSHHFIRIPAKVCFGIPCLKWPLSNTFSIFRIVLGSFDTPTLLLTKNLRGTLLKTLVITVFTVKNIDIKLMSS